MSEEMPEEVAQVVEGEEEPEAQPFEEDDDGGDPDSTEGAEIPPENLDLEPADSADHSDHSEDENEAG